MQRLFLAGRDDDNDDDDDDDDAMQPLFLAGRELPGDGAELADCGVAAESRLEVRLADKVPLVVVAEYMGMYGGPSVYAGSAAE